MNKSARYYLDEVFVHPDARGAGLGWRLVDDVVLWARERDIRRVRLRALAENEKALRFWRSVGASDYVVELTIDLSSG